MFIRVLFIATLIGGTFAAADSCGAGEPSADFKSALNSLRAAERTKSASLSLRQGSVINIPTWLHVVINSTVSEDHLNDDVLSDQVDVLTDRFEPYDIAFELAGTTRTVDDELAQGLDNPDFNNFKFRNRKGDFATLNLYFVTNMNEELGGACTFPSPNMDPSNPLSKLDGCVLQSYSVPGGTGYKDRTFKGEIAVHEVGHWFGLLHTFDGESCDGDGDMIDDTPNQSLQTEFYTCPIGQDSCPDDGEDPIHNFMDYSGEGCWEEFTPDQKERMHNVFFSMRAPNNTTGN